MSNIDPDLIDTDISSPNPEEGFGKLLSELACLSCECAMEAYMALPPRAKAVANMAHHETVAVTIFRDQPDVAVITMFGNDDEGDILYKLQWDMQMVDADYDRWADAEKV